MSSQRGNVARSRAQKYQNSRAFKNDLHNGDSKRVLNQMEITHVCARCVEIVRWKIKFNKYKPLTVPKTCVRCQGKTVKRAYMVACEACTEETKTCAKCLKEPLAVDNSEAGGVTGAEVKEFCKALPERKRRSLHRFLRRLHPGLDVDDIPSGKKFGPDVREFVDKLRALEESSKGGDDEDDLDDLSF